MIDAGAVTERPRTSSAAGDFLADVLSGLGARPKRLSSKYFYDLEGALLFDAICELPEYYVTRTELAILEARVREIVARLCESGEPCRIVEPGAGSGTKTRLLLRALGPRRCVEYVPVDIAGEHLDRTAEQLRAEIAWLRVTPLEADFSADLTWAQGRAEPSSARTVVYFPGSTIGNFDPGGASRLMRRFRDVAGEGGHVLLGVDLKKDPAILHAAYNDAQGVTARFNKNVLRRMNDELGADFDVSAFRHYAFYAPALARVEMHLVSTRSQTVHVGGRAFAFDHGESICTEHSYKYDLPAIERLGRASGLTLVDTWLDDDRRFAVVLFRIVRG